MCQLRSSACLSLCLSVHMCGARRRMHVDSPFQINSAGFPLGDKKPREASFIRNEQHATPRRQPTHSPDCGISYRTTHGQDRDYGDVGMSQVPSTNTKRIRRSLFVTVFLIFKRDIFLVIPLTIIAIREVRHLNVSKSVYHK